MSWQPVKRRHMVKWDPRPTWKRACEWPFRKFYIINYDPFIMVPEDELVWDPPEYDPQREGYAALGLLFMFFAAIIFVIWMMFK